MESDPVFVRYRKLRQSGYERLGAIRAEVDAWIAKYAVEMPSLPELARLEALNAERSRLLAEFIEAEEQFIDHALRRHAAEAQAELQEG